jgi:S-formylglutathione hydrolase FrmB
MGNGTGKGGHAPAGLSRRAALAILTLLTLAFMLTPDQALAAGRAECKTVASRILSRSVRYCVILPDSYDTAPTRKYPVLYHLHGLNDNEQTLLRLGGWDLIERLTAQKKIGEMLVVTPAAGTSFYINSRDGKEKYENFFMQEFIPTIEKRYRAIGTRAGRGITGVSMGGYGALRLALKYPQKFAAVSAHSAALIDRMTEAPSAAFGRAFRAFGEPFDLKFWNENTPFALLRAGASTANLKIYFDCGAQDDFGFADGARQLHQLLLARKVPHEFHIYPGGHDAQYVAEHIDESLEFQSRALGAK